MRKNLFQIFVIIVIIALIGILIFYSQKRKHEFELVKGEANEILKLVNQASEAVQKTEVAGIHPKAYGVFFGLEKAVLFADENENRIFDDQIFAEYNLHENVKLNPLTSVFYIPYQQEIDFCGQGGECSLNRYHYLKISDIKTGRAMEMRFDHKTGGIELREVVDKY